MMVEDLMPSSVLGPLMCRKFRYWKYVVAAVLNVWTF